MSKYIDAEKLKAEIERRMDKHWEGLPDADSPEDEWTHNELCELGAYKELEYLETFINSLQQEQPTKGYDEAYLNECIAKASKTWKGVDVDKYMDEVRGREQEQPEVDLEEEIQMEWDSFNYHMAEYDNEQEEVVWLNRYSFGDVASYFYKLGLNAGKEE